MTQKSPTKNKIKFKPGDWTSPIPEERWRGFRKELKGNDAFKNLSDFEKAQVSELEHCLKDHERQALARLLTRGKKPEIEVFLRTHGANPISDPEGNIDVDVNVAKADRIDLSTPATHEANQAILEGKVVHVLFQAGEATRFNRGPLYNLNVFEVGKELQSEFSLEPLIKKIEQRANETTDDSVRYFLSGYLGPNQLVALRAGLRRIIQDEINSGRLQVDDAVDVYQSALKNQKILFFIGQRGDIGRIHDKSLREDNQFFGFSPENIITIEQELVHGMNVAENGAVSLLNDPNAQDATGHLYVFLQAVRPGGFTTYLESGRPVKPMEFDALGYLLQRGGETISIVRINDMDRHTTEIINNKAYSYAQTMFAKGFVNVIEGVANPGGQKGGTGTTFGDPEIHVLTETHENSYPKLSRAMEQAMKDYLEQNDGRHPAYNAMRQWADLSATRSVLKEFGARVVFVPRLKEIDGKKMAYVGVDMPMGDLSLFLGHYKSRMFQFVGPSGKELLIHDMKKKENLNVALRTIAHQIQDAFMISAANEILAKEVLPFKKGIPIPLYGAPTPEFN